MTSALLVAAGLTGAVVSAIVFIRHADDAEHLDATLWAFIGFLGSLLIFVTGVLNIARAAA